MQELKRGDRGAYVYMLQLALQRSGYLSARKDGIFGPVTENALRGFQSAFMIPVTGTADEKTWRYLNDFIRGYVKYRVKPGDTLFKIAEKNFTTVKSIVTANSLKNPDKIEVGQTLAVPFRFDVVPFDVPYTYELTNLLCEGISGRYPFVELKESGRSVEGKRLNLLEMGKKGRSVLVNASHHANEWITTPLVLKFLERYAASYANSDSIEGFNASRLFENSRLYMMPLVNPDGVDLVNGVADGTYLANACKIAEAYPNIRFPEGWKANIEGTDLNLNYPAEWEKAKGIKYGLGFKTPAPRDFVGENPLSAPESRSVYNLTKSENFVFTISYHTQGEEIYYTFQGQTPPGGRFYGEEFARLSGYRLADAPYNSSFAGYKDWVIQDYNVPSYTIEAGKGENPLPLSELPLMYRDNAGIMAYALSL